MSTRFDANEGLVVVPARIFGPSGDVIIRLALDTGATTTLINTDVMVLVGYDPATAAERIQVTTGSSIEFCAQMIIDRIESIEHVREGFPVLCHTLPPSAQVDGLLGLDFFRHCRLEIDFQTGEVTLATQNT